MNRAQRRAQARTAATITAAATTLPGCADCTARVAPEEVSPGVVVLTIAHDESCPAYRAMTRGDAR